MRRRKEQRPAAARGRRQIEKALCGVAIAKEPLTRALVKKPSCVYERADQSNDQKDIRARALEEINAHKFGVIALVLRIRARQVVPPASNLCDLFPLAQYPITDGQMSCGINHR